MNFDDLDRIFPIVDGPSAQLMKVKALCLNDAGVITAMQKVVIDRRADAVLARAANWVEGNPRRRTVWQSISRPPAGMMQCKKCARPFSTGLRQRSISIPNMGRRDRERSG